MCGGKEPPASNSSPGTFPESPTQPLSEHSQYQKHFNCKERSPWLENPPGHGVRLWRAARACTFQNRLQMVADKIKKHQLGKHAHLKRISTVFSPLSPFFCHLLAAVCSSFLGKEARQWWVQSRIPLLSEDRVNHTSPLFCYTGRVQSVIKIFFLPSLWILFVGIIGILQNIHRLSRF